MSIQKRQQKKKKNRELDVQKKILKKREDLRKEKKLALFEEMQRREIDALTYGKQEPIIDEEKKKARQELKAKAIKEKLEKNLKILEALEKEFEEEEKSRKAVNESLEAEGYGSIKEKMDAIHQKALDLTGKAEEYKKAQQDFEENQKVLEN
ncbi:MAG: hypothetical protein EKK64_10475 [Neisseriaceae bacterium]|nr:MAG: hypothetical protein EKK64_10475 [Neisseriaceae bacterium]